MARSLAGWGIQKDKKIGAESSDPNRHSQPRLPGSVVGEASMRGAGFLDKITKVNAQKLLKKSCQFSVASPWFQFLLSS
jgi:hypothetical protein